MKIIVGLGNPGREYARTRHNAGFMVVDLLAQRHGLASLGSVRDRFHAGVLEGPIAGEKCLLMQPTTFMNRSGLSVGEAVNFYKLEPADDLMIVVDDIALPLGQIRLRASGRAGGHNGLADIQRVLATIDYPRLRVGIDAPTHASQVDYVLGRFSEEEDAALKPALTAACDAIETWITHGLSKAMSLFNARA